MESLTEWWNGVMDIPGASWIIYPSLLFVLILVAYYVLLALRNLAIGGAPVSDDHLGTFRKMRDEGMLAPEEYKKLAGLVPMPEAAAKETNAADIAETGPQALTEAAKEAIRKAAKKRAENESQENEDSVANEEDAESSES